MKNVVLIGFMGCGKTTLGIRLSYRLRRTVEDTDRRIEREQGSSIAEIFATHGEGYFRDLETELLSRIKEEKICRIVSTGGGTPLREENRALLKHIGFVVYLRIRPETVYERLKNDTTRPLLQGENPLEKITQLMGQRQEAYCQCADIILDVDEDESEDILQRILQILKEEGIWEGEGE